MTSLADLAEIARRFPRPEPLPDLWVRDRDTLVSVFPVEAAGLAPWAPRSLVGVSVFYDLDMPAGVLELRQRTPGDPDREAHPLVRQFDMRPYARTIPFTGIIA